MICEDCNYAINGGCVHHWFRAAERALGTLQGLLNAERESTEREDGEVKLGDLQRQEVKLWIRTYTRIGDGAEEEHQ